jgi:soluble cytochrome b562
MTSRIATLCILALALMLPRIASAEDVPNAQLNSKPAAAAAKPEDEKKTELELRMEKMGKAFRKLKKQIADPAQNAASLELISTMIDAANEGLKFTPEKADDVPADQRAQFVADYQAGLKQMIEALTKLKETVAAGNNDAAAKQVADIISLEKKDHQKFKRPEKD